MLPWEVAKGLALSTAAGVSTPKTAPSRPLAVGTGPRWDVQIVEHMGPASSAVAKAVAVDPAKVLEALRLLDSKVYAPTTVGPKASRKRLIEFLIKNAAQGGPYPLTPYRIRCGAACLMAARYRTVGSYLGEAKMEHVRRGHSWNETRALEVKDCVRACMRGLGPPKRAPEVRLSLAAAAEDAQYLGRAGSMLRPRRAWLVAMWWLLREIELAGLTIHLTSTRCWRHRGKRRATLYLPLTKMDQQGRGAARTWECICEGPPLADGGCRQQRQSIRRMLLFKTSNQ